MAVVFINYRVREQPGYAALLYRELTARLGPDLVFQASGSIRPGDDFVDVVFETLRKCEVLLAVIGPRWLETRGAPHGYGLGREVDWVHREIAEAFAAGVRVIPVLIEDAVMPVEDELPREIAALARCQFLRLHHHSIDTDLARLVAEVRRAAPSLAERPGGRLTLPVEPQLFRPSAAGGTRTGIGSECRIGVVTGTILRVSWADVWVNSENTDMEMARATEFSISGIIRYWGSVRDGSGRVVEDVIASGLAQSVGPARPVAPGTVVETASGQLAITHNVRRILHVAAVQGEPGAGFRQVRDIGSCVTNVLMRCEELAAAGPEVRTVLFPLLGTGVAGGELRATAQAMLVAMLDYVTGRPTTRLRAIYLLASTEPEYRTVSEVVAAMPLTPAAPDQD